MFTIIFFAIVAGIGACILYGIGWIIAMIGRPLLIAFGIGLAIWVFAMLVTFIGGIFGGGFSAWPFLIGAAGVTVYTLRRINLFFW